MGGKIGGGSNTITAPPVGCLGWLKLGCLSWPKLGCLGWLKLGCLGWAKLGCLGWLKLGVSAVCSYSKTARSGGCVVVFSGGLYRSPFPYTLRHVRVRYSPF